MENDFKKLGLRPEKPPRELVAHATTHRALHYCWVWEAQAQLKLFLKMSCLFEWRFFL